MIDIIIVALEITVVSVFFVGVFVAVWLAFDGWSKKDDSNKRR